MASDFDFGIATAMEDQVKDSQEEFATMGSCQAVSGLGSLMAIGQKVITASSAIVAAYGVTIACVVVALA